MQTASLRLAAFLLIIILRLASFTLMGLLPQLMDLGRLIAQIICHWPPLMMLWCTAAIMPVPVLLLYLNSNVSTNPIHPVQEPCIMGLPKYQVQWLIFEASIKLIRPMICRTLRGIILPLKICVTTQRELPRSRLNCASFGSKGRSAHGALTATLHTAKKSLSLSTPLFYLWRVLGRLPMPTPIFAVLA